MKIYPEIWRSRDETKAPKFPPACPVCGAAETSPGVYACGGAYQQKAQIQRHTDKWWGECPSGVADASCFTPNT